MTRSQYPLAGHIDKKKPSPIYQQLIQAVLDDINDGTLKKGQMMPSINALSAQYQVTRSTVEKVYGELRDRGVLGSHHGKGFFVKEIQEVTHRRILCLFSTYTVYHKSIVDAFSKVLGSDAVIEMAIYANDPKQFVSILKEQRVSYSHYIIVPNFSGDSTEAYRLIRSLPKDKLILLGGSMEQASVVSYKSGMVSAGF